MAGLNRKKSVFCVALCGVFSAMSVVSLLLSSVFAVVDVSLSALAGLFLLPVVLECGCRYALCAWGVVSVLGLILCPNKEMPILFVCLIGYYPILKVYMDRRFRRAKWLLPLRLVLANVAIGIAYGVMFWVLGLNYVISQFADTGVGMLIVLVVLTNLALVVFDVAMEQLCALYCRKISPKIHRAVR